MVVFNLIEIAIEIAMQIHAGQFDKGGKPYILHPLRVMSKFLDLDYQVVAVLHDVLEDSCLLPSNLIASGIPEDLVEEIQALSRYPEQETYEEFIDRICRSSDLVKAVKLADLEDNMQFARCIDPGMFKRYIPAWQKIKASMK